MRTLYTLGILLCSILLFSCGGKSPEIPENNALDLGHDLPTKTVFTFVEGSFGEDFIHNEVFGKGFSPLVTSSPKTMTIQESADGKSHILSGSPELKPDTWYKLSIDFYNKAGKNINYSYFETEEMLMMHQLFFQAFEIDSREEAPTPYGKQIDRELLAKQSLSEKRLQYLYGAEYPDGSYPKYAIGFNGYIYFSKRLPEDFFLRVTMVHVVPPSVRYNVRTGKTFPYDQPSKTLLNVRDLNVYLPIRIAPSV